MLFKKNQTIVFAGDSITDCDRKKPEGEGAPAFNPLGNGYVNLISGYLHSQYPELHLRIINQGISGHRSVDLVKRWDVILSLNPDWLLLMIGANDVWRLFDCPEIDYLHSDVGEYEKNIEAMIIKTQATKTNLIILAPFMMELNLEDPMRKELLIYQNSLSKLTQKYQVPYLDIQTAFDNLLKNIHNHE
ncbi:MAG: GDSL-type esterase/lipase family protein, partial [Bacilli bacterium]|nr:GDSL-type esterase/lipase family protein [Bacilli bacterium]